MKHSSMDIDFFIQQLAILKSGAALEKSKVVTGLRRICNHIKDVIKSKKQEGKFKLEVTYLEKSHSTQYDWEGMSKSDEYYDCAASAQAKVGISVIIRDPNNSVVRSAVFAMPSELAYEIFGVTNSIVDLDMVPTDASILTEKQIADLTTVKKEDKQSTTIPDTIRKPNTATKPVIANKK